MRFITVNLRCDWADCDTIAPEESGEVTELSLAVDRRAPKVIGLCLKHREELTDLLEPLLAKGVTVEEKAPKNRPSRSKAAGAGQAASSGSGEAPETVPSHVDVHCKVPGCGQPVKGNVGLAQHLKKKHDGMTRAEHDLLPEPEKT
jgi:hypothetical protein